MKVLFFISSFISFHVSASPPPCKEWQSLVKAHLVKKHLKADGTNVKKAKRKHIVERSGKMQIFGDLLLKIENLSFGQIRTKFLKSGPPEKKINYLSLFLKYLHG